MSLLFTSLDSFAHGRFSAWGKPTVSVITPLERASVMRRSWTRGEPGAREARREGEGLGVNRLHRLCWFGCFPDKWYSWLLPNHRVSALGQSERTGTIWAAGSLPSATEPGEHTGGVCKLTSRCTCQHASNLNLSSSMEKISVKPISIPRHGWWWV